MADHPEPLTEAAGATLRIASEVLAVVIDGQNLRLRVMGMKPKDKGPKPEDPSKAERRAMHTAARFRYEPVLNPAFVTKANTVQLTQAWTAALPWAKDDQLAARAMARAESRLAELHPAAMQRNSELIAMGLDPAEAMVAVAPLFDPPTPGPSATATLPGPRELAPAPGEDPTLVTVPVVASPAATADLQATAAAPIDVPVVGVTPDAPSAAAPAPDVPAPGPGVGTITPDIPAPTVGLTVSGTGADTLVTSADIPVASAAPSPAPGASAAPPPPPPPPPPAPGTDSPVASAGADAPGATAQAPGAPSAEAPNLSTGPGAAGAAVATAGADAHAAAAPGDGTPAVHAGAGMVAPTPSPTPTPGSTPGATSDAPGAAPEAPRADSVSLTAVEPEAGPVVAAGREPRADLTAGPVVPGPVGAPAADGPATVTDPVLESRAGQEYARAQADLATPDLIATPTINEHTIGVRASEPHAALADNLHAGATVPVHPAARSAQAASPYPISAAIEQAPRVRARNAPHPGKAPAPSAAPSPFKRPH